MTSAWLTALLGLFSGILTVPTEQAPAAARGAAAATAPDHFPHSSRALSIPAPQGDGPTAMWLVDQLAEIGGVPLAASVGCRKMLEGTPLGLFRALEVPPEEVWSLAEALLWSNGFVLQDQREGEPRLVQVFALATSERNQLRNNALFVPEERVAAYARHPALIVTTVVHMPHTDVRTLSNSMRAMLTDANTQQLVPVGAAGSMVVTANGTALASLVAMLRLVDEANAAAGMGRSAGDEEPGSSER